MKIISWNVNGIRAAMNKGFMDFVKEEMPDVLCLQETKAHPDQVDHELEDLGYKYEYWNSAEKKGYSGTAVFSKVEPLSVSYGMGIEEHDKEGRVISVEYDDFYLVTVYTPNSKRGLARLPYRKVWDEDFLKYVKMLEEKKSVVFCGDLNVAHKEIDLKNDKGNRTTKTNPGNPGFTDQERASFDNVIEAGFVDSFRYLYPKEEQYTWWSYMFNARAKNVGWRIDYFCISDVLKDKLKDCVLMGEVLGSDHCPVKLDIDLK